MTELQGVDADARLVSADADGHSWTAAPRSNADPAVVDAARHYLVAARSDATRRAYASDWANFTAWCATQRDDHGQLVSALPAGPETVALYLAGLAATHKPVTLVRRCSAISAVHQAAGHPSPTTHALVRTTLAGIRRVHGVAPVAKDPLLAHQVRRLLDALPTDPLKALLAARDRALLVVGFYGALRRSELVALDTTDVEVTEHGLVLSLRRSKTDQEGAGRRIALLHTGSVDSCPVETYQAWRTARQEAQPPAAASSDQPPVTDGHPAGAADPTSPSATADDQPPHDSSAGGAGVPVFCAVTRHGQPSPTRLADRSVARIIQRSAARAGLGHLDLAGHSLRAGFATSAAAAGKSERSIMKQTGHTSLPMVRRYIREGSLYRDNPTDGLTL